MRTVGCRTEPVELPLQANASAAALQRGLTVVDAAATFGWATSTGQRKGVYRFKSFEAMEAHRLDCIALAMADLAVRRQLAGTS